MNIEELKKIKPSTDNFIHYKKSVGFPDWTFDEIVNYLGYDKALEIVRSYDISDRFGYCKPVKQFRELTSNIKGFILKIKIKSFNETQTLEYKTDNNGFLPDGRNIKELITEFKKEGKVIQKVKHKSYVLD